LRSGGAEYPARPCASCGADSAETVDIRFTGAAERPDVNEAVSAVSSFEEEALLGESFWAKGYCVDSVGLDADMIRKYVRYQEKKEQQLEQLQLID